MTEEEEVRNQPVVATAEELTLNDLAVVLQIIDVCSKRGAFEGNELKDVGTLRNRIALYVNARVPAQEEEEAEGEADQASENVSGE
jgi:hypothetical protein